MRRLPTLVVALSCAGLLMGCPKSPPPPARSDAGAEASAERGPYTLAFVARDASHSRFAAIDDDPLLLDAGFFVYEVASDGILRRLGNAADYAPLVDELPDDMFGYEAQPKFRHRRSQRIDGKVVLTPYGEHPTSFQWDGRAWKRMSQPVRAELGSGMPLPVLADAGITAPEGGWGDAHRVRDGRYAWSRGTDDGVEIYVASPHGGPGKVTNPVKRHPKTGGPVKYPRCAFLPSMDTRLYVECSMHAGEDGEWSSHVYRLDGDDTWVHIDIPERRRHGAVAFDADGALWFGFGSEGLGIGRRTTDGTTTKFEMPKPDPATAKPSFHLDTIATETRAQARGDVAEGSYRQWTAGRVVTPEAECRPSHVNWIVPRPSGDVWIGLSCGSSNMILRASRSAYKAPPIVIGTMFDGLNELRNTKPPRPWVAHCNQLFVTLAKASGEAGALNVDRILAERGAIEDLTKAFGTSDSYVSQASIVSGRLHDRNVAGVLLARTYPDAKEAAMEKAARDLVERFTTNPASPPEVFCTLPVLERAL